MADHALLMQAADWTPAQKALYTAAVQLFLARNPRGRRILAVDGRPGVGKRHFADALRVAFARAGVPSVRASLDDFANAREKATARGADSEFAYYADAYNLELFDRVLLEPFRMGEAASFQTRVFDRSADRPLPTEWVTADPNAVLIVDGEFLQRPLLRGKWHFVLRLEASDAELDARARNGRDDRGHGISAGQRRRAHERYERESDAVRGADMVVDNTDWRRPLQFFADSC